MIPTFFMLRTNKMKFINLFIYTYLILFTYNCAQHSPSTTRDKRQVVRSYYDNGNIEYKSFYLNDKLDGPTYYYSKSNHLISYTEYKQGYFHGKSILYFKNGHIKLESLYKDGHLHGQENYYYRNGNLKLRNVYNFGVKMKTIRWKENGILIR